MPNELEASVRHRAIEFLAGESSLPFDQVQKLYEAERAQLEHAAHVTKYLPIFTFRNVQLQLLQRPA